MNRFKRLISTMLSVMMITSLTFGSAWGATPWNAQIRPGVSTGAGQTDFTTDFFIPIAGNDQSVFFLNPHLRIDDNSGNEQNIGLGFRTFLSGDKVILGGNAYYDSMQSKYSNRYGQFGLGMEVLSKWVDFRANYYNPTGSRKNKVHGLDHYSFANTSLVVNEGYEAALRGFDAEVGVMIPGISDVIETRAFIGGFWYDSPISKDLNGWKGRIEIKPSKLINIDVEMRHDQVRGTDTIFGAYLNIPFSIDELTKGGNPFKGFADAAAFGKGARTMKERMTQKVVRDRYITTIADSSTEDRKTVIKDMIYVSEDNNDDYATRDGSLKHPWISVNEAENRDGRWVGTAEGEQGSWVYVFHQDKNHLKDPYGNQHTYYNNHTQLEDNMVLWGEGYRHPVFKLGGLKGKSNPDMNPILDGEGNGEDEVIRLANNNEIMGLTIQNGWNHGILGESIKSTYIHDNIIQDNGKPCSGIHIENYFDSADMSNQTLSYRFANNEILNNEGSGIYLKNEVTGETSLDNFHIFTEFTENHVAWNYAGDTPWGTGIYVKNDVSLSRGMGTTSTTESLSITNSSINNVFTKNIIEDNEGKGIRVKNNFSTEVTVDGNVTGSGNVSSTISNVHINNTFTGNEITDTTEGTYYGGRDAIDVENTISADPHVYGYLTGSATVTASVTGSSINNTLTDNIIAFNRDSGTGISLLNTISAYNELDEGIYDVYDANTVTVTASVNDSSINNKLKGNTVTYAGNEQSGTGIALDNYITAVTDIYGDIYEFDSDGKATVTASVTDSSINNTLTDNTVKFADATTTNNWNQGTGISIDDYIYANIDMQDDYIRDLSEGTSVTLEASVADSSGITNTLSGNTVTFGSGTYEENISGTGINIWNSLSAWVGVEDVYDFWDDAAATVKASVSKSTISNTLKDNTVDFGSYIDNSTGIDVENYLYASIENQDGIYNIDDGNEGGKVAFTSSVVDSGISNTLTGNSVNFDDYVNNSSGIVVYNDMFASIDMEGDIYELDGTSAVELTASVDNSGISNTLTGNTVEFGSNTMYSRGIFVDDYLSASVDLMDYEEYDLYDISDAASVTLTASVINGSSIENTLTNNDVTYNGYVSYSTGIEIYNDLWAVVDVDDVYDFWNTDAKATLNAEVADTTITNKISDNTVAFGDNVYEATGIRMSNYIDAHSDIEGDIRDITDSTVDENATVTNAAIDNTLTGNTVTFGTNTTYATGIGIENRIMAFIDQDDYIQDLHDSIVNMTSSVSGSSISNTLDGNSISFGSEDSSSDIYYVTGIYIGNDIHARVEMDDIDIENLSGDAVLNRTASVTDSFIANEVTDNTVTFGLTGSTDSRSGIYIENEIFADDYASYNSDIEGMYGDSQVNVTNSVTGSYISNIVTGNTVTNPYYNGINVYSDIWAAIDVDDIGGEWGYIDDFAGVKLEATVTDSYITNTVDANEVTFADTMGGTGININSEIYSKIYVGDVREMYDHAEVGLSATVEGASIENTVTNNTVTYGNESWGTGIDIENHIYAVINTEHIHDIYDDVDIVLNAKVTDSLDTLTSITNSLTDNSVTYGTGSNGTGISIHNEIYADDYTAGIYDVYGEFSPEIDIKAEVALSASIASISNSLIDNNVEYGTESYGTGIDVTNTIYAETFSDDTYTDGGDVYLTSIVTDSSITNTLTGNKLLGAGYDSGDGIYISNDIYSNADMCDEDYSDYSEVIASVSGAVIRNTLTSNTISYFDDNGVHIENWINAETDGDHYESSTIADSNIYNTFTSNRISFNGEAGVRIYNELAAYGSEVSDSSINDYFTGNVIEGNGDTGIHLTYFTATDSNDSNEINIFMERNKVVDTDGTGVYADYGSGGDGGYDGESFDVIADLGNGDLGSTGRNWFSDNSYWQFDTSDFSVTAENNWWGTAGDPGSLLYGDVDYTPWLTTAPKSPKAP